MKGKSEEEYSKMVETQALVDKREKVIYVRRRKVGRR